jgi:virulence-associated protein VapD
MRKFLQNNKFRLKNKLSFIYESNDFINLNHLITPKLNMIIDNISKQIPNFYVGRYDIRAYTLEQLINGKFYILEANGTMGFDLKYQCYKNNYINFYGFLDRMRWIFIRFYYGLINILSFNCVNVNIIFIAIYNAINCLDIEKLFSVYT